MPPITRVNWSASNLPAGLILNPNTGILSGTPTVEGEYTVPVTVETNWGSATKNINISVESVVEVDPVWVERSFSITNSNSNTDLCSISTATPKIFYTYTTGLIVPFLYSKSTSTKYLYCLYADYAEDGQWRAAGLGSASSPSPLSGYATGVNAVTYDSPYTYLAFSNSKFTGLHALKYDSGGLVMEVQITSGFPSVADAGVCYSSDLGSTLYVSTTGLPRLIQNNKVTYTSSTAIMSTVKAGCVAWSSYAEVFCIAGGTKTATSPDGKTWTTHSGIPSGYSPLEYRYDINSFVTRVGNTFYSSQDGATWTNMFPEAALPSSVTAAGALGYSDEYDLYCLVASSKTNIAYFSRDLAHWKATTIPASISVGDVKYSPLDKAFMLLPKSGKIYYTFKINQLNLARWNTWQDS